MLMGGWSRRLLAWLAVAGVVAACGTQPPRPPVEARTSPAANSATTCNTVSLSASQQSPITAGQLVVVTARATGCRHPEFRFVLGNAAGTTGSVTQDWGTASTWTWDTATAATGRYAVRGDVRSFRAGAAGAPEAAAYLSFTVIGAAAPVAQSCRLPVSGTLPGSGGFIQLPGGGFTADPASNVAFRGQPDASGLRRGYTYDPVHGRWLPVPRDWVMPDYSSYVYVGTEYPHASNQPALHRVVLASGSDTLWVNGDQLYGFPIALRPEGVYGAPGPEIITLVDPVGAVSTIDQGHYGLFSVITPIGIWATKSAGFASLSTVQRIDPHTQVATDWFEATGATALPIGVDGVGNPIIAVGTQLPNGRMAATQIWIAPLPTPTGAAAPNGQEIYSDAAHPLTLIGWPILSGGAIWIETDQGLWTDDAVGGAPITLVSSHSGFIAGGCR